MNNKTISTTLVGIIFLVFFLLPTGLAQAINGTIPSITPIPSTSSGPDYTDFGSSSGGSLVGIGLGAGGCFAGMALGLFTGGSDYWYCIDNFIIRPVMRTISNSIENNMLNQIGSVVTDKLGNGKNPHFVTDWRNSILDSSARGNDIFRSVLADTDLCPYFGDFVKQTFGADLFGGVIKNLGGSGSKTNIPGTASFQLLNKCSLSNNINVDAFRNDFTQGGWSAWLELQKPENNFESVLSKALTEQQTQMDVEKQAASEERIANQGSLPNRQNSSGETGTSSGTVPEDCVAYANSQCTALLLDAPDRQQVCFNKNFNECTNRSAGSGTPGPNGAAASGLTRPIFLGKTITPGKLFGDATAKVFDQKFETIGGAQEIQDLILALADSVINKLSGRLTNLLGSGGGKLSAPNLNGASRAICVANCQLASYPQCSAPLPPDTTLTCTQRAVTACQQACP